MIQKFVDRFMENKETLREAFAEFHPLSYGFIVRKVVKVIGEEFDYPNPDPEKIHCIDDGDYQGTLVFVIGDQHYQPSYYWSVKVDYGTCSGCDILEDIRDYSDIKPTKQQVEDYMTLALHIVQGIKEI